MTSAIHQDRQANPARLHRGAIVLIAALAVTACTTNTGPQLVSQRLPQPGEALPGPNTPDITVSSALFTQICANNAPSSRGPLAEIDALPFAYNDTDQLYYHRDYDLSVTLFDVDGAQVCSMITATNERPGPALRTIERDIPMDGYVATTASRAPDGQQYINISFSRERF